MFKRKVYRPAQGSWRLPASHTTCPKCWQHVRVDKFKAHKEKCEGPKKEE
jgi:hypothetical protein